MNWRVERLADVAGALTEQATLLADVKAIMISPEDEVICDDTAAVIVSRLPLRWNSEDEWLSAVRRAVTWIRDERRTFVGSVGSAGWEYISWYAGQLGIRSIIVLPPGTLEQVNVLAEQVLHDLELQPNNITFIAPVMSGKPSKEERLRSRDELILRLSKVLFPVAVRRGGYWDSVCASSERISSEYLVSYPVSAKSTDWSTAEKTSVGLEFPWDDYLIHLTRGNFAPWQGELKSDYFEALTDNRSGNPRDELATLVYILTSGILRGSGSVIRDGVPVVSFSAANPYSLLAGSSVRSRLHWQAFQSYGFAIPKTDLMSLGAKPVIYGTDEDFRQLPSLDRPFFQAHGGNRSSNDRTDWKQEKEYRLIGDLDIISLGNALITLVPTVSIGRKIAGRSAGKTLHLFED